MDAITYTSQTATAKAPMGREEFATRLAELSAKYGPNVALRMVRRERKLRHPLHKSAVISRRELADVAIESTGEFHNL